MKSTSTTAKQILLSYTGAAEKRAILKTTVINSNTVFTKL
jgi:hypothetical protein